MNRRKVIRALALLLLGLLWAVLSTKLAKNVPIPPMSRYRFFDYQSHWDAAVRNSLAFGTAIVGVFVAAFLSARGKGSFVFKLVSMAFCILFFVTAGRNGLLLFDDVIHPVSLGAPPSAYVVTRQEIELIQPGMDSTDATEHLLGKPVIRLPKGEVLRFTAGEGGYYFVVEAPHSCDFEIKVTDVRHGETFEDSVSIIPATTTTQPITTAPNE